MPTTENTSILYIIDDFGPGGVETFLLQQIRGLDKTKYRPLFCMLFSGKEQLCKQLAGEAEEMLRLNLKKANLPFGLLKLLILIRTQRVKIVQTNRPFADMIGALVGKAAGCKVISHKGSLNYPQRKLRGWLHRLSLKLCDRVISVSRPVERGFRKQGLEQRKSQIIHYGIHADRFLAASEDARAKITKDFGVQEYCNLVGSVGNLRWEKGYPTLIEAAKEVIRHLPNTVFLIVGGGHARPLEAIARKFAVDKSIIFAGQRLDVPLLLAGFNLFVMSSWSEGFGLAILEAMAAGKAVVATAVGGIPEIVDNGITGVLVPPRDPKELAKAIVSLLTDKSKANRMAAAGRARVKEHFSLQTIVSEYEKIYEDLLHRG